MPELTIGRSEALRQCGRQQSTARSAIRSRRLGEYFGRDGPSIAICSAFAVASLDVEQACGVGRILGDGWRDFSDLDCVEADSASRHGRKRRGRRRSHRSCRVGLGSLGGCIRYRPMQTESVGRRSGKLARTPLDRACFRGGFRLALQ